MAKKLERGIAILSEHTDAWQLVLAEFRENANSRQWNNDDASQTEIPFAEVWVALCDAVWCVDARRQIATTLLSSGALNSIKEELAKKFADIASLALWGKFLFFCSIRQPTAFEIANRCSNRLYRLFVDELHRNALREFFNEYPAIESLLATAAAQWTDFFQEFLSRLEGDSEALKNEFGSPNHQWKIDAVSSPLSDPHNSGRTVLALTVSEPGPVNFLYKPKNIESERIYRKTLEFLSANGFPWPFSPVRSLPREGYGWVEFVHFGPVETEEQLSDYYRRIGAILSVARFLRLGDIHFDNLVASGNVPHVLDLEAIFLPGLMRQHASFSVLDTGLLPISGEDPIARDNGTCALTSVSESDSGALSLRWTNLRLDSIQVESRTGVFSPMKNAPCFDGVKIEPYDCIEDIVQGFALSYDILLSNFSRLSEELGLNRDEFIKTRLVLRSTIYYQILIDRLLIPKYLKSPMIAQRMIRQALSEGSRHALLSNPEFRRAEIKAILNLDIPCFLYNLETGEITESNAFVAKINRNSAREDDLSTLNSLDKDVQIALIRKSLVESRLQDETKRRMKIP